MPVYQVLSPEDLLSGDQRERIAADITEIHTGHTGAPATFVNVVFIETPETLTFRAGRPSRLSIVAGEIREGREIEVRQAMLADLAAMWRRVTGQPENEVVLALREVDPRAVVEFGLVLPTAGEEAAWFEEHRERLVELGVIP